MLMNASRVDRAVGEHKESTVLYICISMDWFEYTNHHIWSPIHPLKSVRFRIHIQLDKEVRSLKHERVNSRKSRSNSHSRQIEDS